MADLMKRDALEIEAARLAGDAGWQVTSPVMLPATGRAVRLVRGDPSRRSIALGDFEQTVRALAGGAK